MASNYMSFLDIFISYVEIILNTIAICIVIISVIKGFIKQYKGVGKAKHVICKGISDALNYNLATEVLKIIASRDLKDLMVIGGILILKAMITGLFMLEIKQDEMREKFDNKNNLETKKNKKISKSK